MYRVLISNDDGVNGPGLRPLIKEMSKIAKVYVVVPKSQMSGTGHAITLSKYKKAAKVAEDFYAVAGGTPADCVKYGLLAFGKDNIDLVISGINTCPNMGQDVIYSGTVGAAREGAMKGIASIAVSAAEMHSKEYKRSAIATRQIAEKILKNKKKYKAVCLNINIPKNYKGIKVVPLGLNDYNENIAVIADKKGNFSYKLTGRFFSGGKNKGSDIDMVEKGYISVTSLQIDQTDFKTLKKIKL
ncbi:MAG: 5'/3'-nucleotidase SurE [Endomicrobia bacterium]|nr:5'/3'-nucleotidase SurE [Endomicrobiia bacterium]MCL2507068.1 5'/3'-nucleotidase SurE [Endomicrobiia bacterium]